MFSTLFDRIKGNDKDNDPDVISDVLAEIDAENNADSVNYDELDAELQRQLTNAWADDFSIGGIDNV